MSIYYLKKTDRYKTVEVFQTVVISICSTAVLLLQFKFARCYFRCRFQTCGQKSILYLNLENEMKGLTFCMFKNKEVVGSAGSRPVLQCSHVFSLSRELLGFLFITRLTSPGVAFLLRYYGKFCIPSR